MIELGTKCNILPDTNSVYEIVKIENKEVEIKDSNGKKAFLSRKVVDLKNIEEPYEIVASVSEDNIQAID